MGGLKFQLPENPDLAVRVIDNETASEKTRMERGFMGALFGLSKEKPGNIAGFVLILSFIMLGLVLLFGVDTPSLTKKDMVLVIAGFITTTLGFVFGRTTS